MKELTLALLFAPAIILFHESEAFASNGIVVRRSNSSTRLAETPMGRRDSFGGMATTLIGAGAVAGLAEFLKDTLKKNADLKLAERSASVDGDVLVSGLKNAASNGMCLYRDEIL